MEAKKNTNGFTLIECVIAMVLVVTGFMAIFSLLTICLRTEVISRELTTGNSLARLKIEELKNLPRPSGGSLTNDVTNYFDQPNSRYTRRWQISTDSMGTQTVVVIMTPNTSSTLLPEVRLTTRMN
ncbi:MAG TPA: prepilin-type N-terminal cleavage/methylation domain-containing protein [Pyrinomonadaceae bacterium]|nr:prepilin-type N-terminal cleavage/methylation domain-containing protein [Pyrinomonadaceae bacterium]